MKPYHESYFSDNPPSSITQSRTTTPVVQSSQSTISNGEVAPLEGLAATLHARMLNNQSNHGTPKNEHSSSNNKR